MTGSLSKNNTLGTYAGRGLWTVALCSVMGVAASQDAGTRYAQTVTDAAVTERYNTTIQQYLTSQEEEIASLQRQIAELDTTAVEVTPLLQRMFEELERFVLADVPFLKMERDTRLERLRTVMGNIQATPSEKFRRIFEAYQIEMEYGRTMDAYKEMLDGQETQFVRLGRVSLMYVKEDGETGYWDNQQKAWIKDQDYARAIQQALEIANETTAQDLITVPVPAPQGGRS